MPWPWSKRISDSRKEENFWVSHAVSPFRSPIARCRLPSLLHSSLNPRCLIVHQMLWMDETFIKFHADADSFHWCETSRSKQALAWAEMTFFWIDRTGWVHEVTFEIITTWLGGEQHQAGCWIDLAQTRALLEPNGCRKALAKPQPYGSMIDVNQGIHLAGSEWYVGTI
jgi:hypothetical protein